jgi:hypothetical protein
MTVAGGGSRSDYVHGGKSRTETRWRRRQPSALPTILAAQALIGYQYASGSDSLSQATSAVGGRSSRKRPD